MQLAVIIPLFNEAATVEALLHRVTAAPSAITAIEIIAMNDCSTDRITEFLSRLQPCYLQLTVVHHATNMRQGTALRTGMAVATGAKTVWL